MIIEIRKSFEKDAMKLSVPMQNQLAIVIEKIAVAKNLSDIPNCKKLTGFKTAYRVRMGNYRLGLFVEGKTVELVRILSRKDIYKYYP